MTNWTIEERRRAALSMCRVSSNWLNIKWNGIVGRFQTSFVVLILKAYFCIGFVLRSSREGLQIFFGLCVEKGFFCVVYLYLKFDTQKAYYKMHFGENLTAQWRRSGRFWSLALGLLRALTWSGPPDCRWWTWSAGVPTSRPTFLGDFCSSVFAITERRQNKPGQLENIICMFFFLFFLILSRFRAGWAFNPARTKFHHQFSPKINKIKTNRYYTCTIPVPNQ